MKIIVQATQRVKRSVGIIWTRSGLLTAFLLLLLSLGIGASGALLGLAARATSPHVPDSEKLFWFRYAQASGIDGVTPAQLNDLMQHHEQFSRVGGYIPPGRRGQPDILNLEGRKHFVNTAQVTPSILGMMHNQFAVGRNFQKDETDFLYDNYRVVILSWRTWQALFNGDPRVIGKSVRFTGSPYPNGTDLTVIGVLSRDAVFPAASDIFVPLSLYDDHRLPAHAVRVLLDARAKISVASVQQIVHRVSVEARWPTTSAYSLQQIQIDRFRPGMLGAMAALFRLISAICVCSIIVALSNACVMAVIRARDRQQSIAIKLGLGATKLELVKRAMPGAVFLCVIASAGVITTGYLLDAIMLKYIGTFAPGYIVSGADRTINGAMVVAVCMAMLAWKLSPIALVKDTQVAAMLRVGRGLVAARIGQRLTATLVFTQCAVLGVTGLYTASAFRHYLQQRDGQMGIELSNLYEIRCVLPRDEHRDYFKVGSLLGLMSDRLNENPKEFIAGASVYLPAEPGPYEGTTEVPSLQAPATTNVEGVSPGYFKALGIALRAGRSFRAADMTAVASKQIQPAIFDEASILKMGLRDQNAPGIQTTAPGGTDRAQIVGVVNTIHIADEEMDTMYVPMPDAIITGADIAFHIFVRTRDSVELTEQWVHRQTVSVLPGVQFSSATQAENLFPLQYQLIRLQSIFGLVGLMVGAVAAIIGVFTTAVWQMQGSIRNIVLRQAFGSPWLKAVTPIVRRLFVLSSTGTLLGVMFSAWILPRTGLPVANEDVVSMLTGCVLLLGGAFLCASAFVQLHTTRRSLADHLKQE